MVALLTSNTTRVRTLCAFLRICSGLGSLPQHFLQAVSAADNLGNPLHIGSNCPDLVFAQLSDGNAAKENTSGAPLRVYASQQAGRLRASCQG